VYFSGNLLVDVIVDRSLNILTIGLCRKSNYVGWPQEHIY